jgi:hypothetical protein
MKTHSGMKREPIAKAVSPAGVSQIGEAMGNHATDSGKILHGASKPLYVGRGFEAPKTGTTVHHGGSQRRHG